MLKNNFKKQRHTFQEFLKYSYKKAPLRVRLHVLGRWHLSPFRSLAKFLPSGHDIVDLGCGHGIWPLYLAWTDPQRRIWAADTAENKIKIAHAACATSGLQNLSFHLVDAQHADFPKCDAISIVDVLYLIPYPEQESILTHCVRQLRPGGRLLIKEIGQSPRWKYLVNYVEELLAVRALHITHGNSFYFRSSTGWMSLLNKLGLQATIVPLDHGYPHPHVLIYGDKS